MSVSVRAKSAWVALVVAVAMTVASFSVGPASAATTTVTDEQTAAATDLEVQRLQQEAAEYLALVASIPDSVIAKGDAAVLQYIQSGKGTLAVSARGLGDLWQVTKCVAAIGIAVASTVFAVAKIAKIKKLIKAAGGVKKTAERVVKAFKAKGSLSAKAKSAFGDLGSGAVALAVVVLDIDTIKDQCS